MEIIGSEVGTSGTVVHNLPAIRPLPITSPVGSLWPRKPKSFPPNPITKTIVREATELEFHSKNRDREDNFVMSRS